MEVAKRLGCDLLARRSSWEAGSFVLGGGVGRERSTVRVEEETVEGQKSQTGDRPRLVVEDQKAENRRCK